MAGKAAVPSPPGRRHWVTRVMIEGRDWRRRAVPSYSVHEVAKVFFGMSSSWLRLHLSVRDKFPLTSFVLDGRPMEFERRQLQCKICRGKGKVPLGGSDTGACGNCQGSGSVDAPEGQDTGRLFWLSDIEPMARSLQALGVIGERQLQVIVEIVVREARLFGLFCDRCDEPPARRLTIRAQGPGGKILLDEELCAVHAQEESESAPAGSDVKAVLLSQT